MRQIREVSLRTPGLPYCCVTRDKMCTLCMSRSKEVHTTPPPLPRAFLSMEGPSSVWLALGTQHQHSTWCTVEVNPCLWVNRGVKAWLTHSVCSQVPVSPPVHDSSEAAEQV